MFDDGQDSDQIHSAFEKAVQTAIESPDLNVRVEGLMYFVHKFSSKPQNNEEVVPYALAAADLYEELNQPLKQFGALWSAADAYKAMGLTKECLAICEQAHLLAISNFAAEHQAIMLNNIALAHLEHGEVHLAYEAASGSALIWASEQKPLEAGKAFSLLADINRQKGDLDEACLNHDEAIKHLKAAGANRRLVEAFWRKTDVLINSGRWEEAIEAHSVCLAHQHLLRHELHDIPIIYNEARLKSHQQLYGSAIEMFEEVLTFWRSKGNLENLVLVTIELSKALSAMGRQEQAEEELKAVLLVADNDQFEIDLSEIHGQLQLISAKEA